MSFDPTKFPVQHRPTLGVSEVCGYLATLVAQGHSVLRDPDQQNVFYVLLSGDYRTRIIASDGSTQVQLEHLSNLVESMDATSVPELEKVLAALAAMAPGSSWPVRPTSVRLAADSPSSNYWRIAQLVGPAEVTAVFDPYLDNRTLEELGVILSFGDGKVSSGVRLLGGSAKSQSKIPKFTAAGVAAWLLQHGISGEARTLASTTTPEHRRFLLLSDGRSVISGYSLNSPHKNEAVHAEPGSSDITFFEKQWNSAQPL